MTTEIRSIIRVSPALARYIQDHGRFGETPSKVLERKLEISRDPDRRTVAEREKAGR